MSQTDLIVQVANMRVHIDLVIEVRVQCVLLFPIFSMFSKPPAIPRWI